MADITLSWPTLTCPVLALRQAAPWRWKTSATSSLGRRTAAGLRPLSRPRPPFAQRREPVERAGYRADRGVGDARVKRRGIELRVAEQHLDHANVGILFQEVGSEAVPQRVRRHPLLDPGRLGSGVDGSVELAGRERLDRIATRKHAALRRRRWRVPPCTSALAPPGAKGRSPLHSARPAADAAGARP